MIWPTLADIIPDASRDLLEVLPCEPNGLSIHELADGLVGRRDPRARAYIRRALEGLSAMLGGLATTRGCDDFGHADVALWGLPRDTYRVVLRIYGLAGSTCVAQGSTGVTTPDSGGYTAEPRR